MIVDAERNQWDLLRGAATPISKAKRAASNRALIAM
jgi:hypothetical protein